MLEFYLFLALKLGIGFVCLILFLNISGRAQLAPLSAGDQIGNYVLGGIIGGVIYNPDIEILEMILVIVIWGSLILITRFIKNRNRVAKKLLDGHSINVFANNTINTQALLISGRSVRDFVAGLHMQEIHKLDDVDKVWLEPNGHYTVLMKGQTPFAISLVEDGQIVQESLESINQTKKWLKGLLSELGVKKISEVIYAEWYKDEGPPDKDTVNIYYYNGKIGRRL